MCIPCVILIHLYTPIYPWQKNKIRIYIATPLHLYNPSLVSCRLPHLYIIYITSSLILAVHITKRIRRKRKKNVAYINGIKRAIWTECSHVYIMLLLVFSLHSKGCSYYIIMYILSFHSILSSPSYILLLSSHSVGHFCGTKAEKKKHVHPLLHNMIRIICK